MSNLLKWILAGLLALSLVVVARASLENTYYLPVVYNQPTLTPTPTSTATITPTVTPTPTITPTPFPHLVISKIVYAPVGDPLDEYVEIVNWGTKSTKLQGWTLKDEGTNVFDFPDFTLGIGDTVRVWTTVGHDDSQNLYWDLTAPVWNDVSDCAYLRDPDKNKVDKLCYHGLVFFRP